MKAKGYISGQYNSNNKTIPGHFVKYRALLNMMKTTIPRGWRDDSVSKSTGSSSRDPMFSLRYPHSMAYTLYFPTSVLQGPAPFYGLWGAHTCGIPPPHPHVYAHKSKQTESTIPLVFFLIPHVLLPILCLCVLKKKILFPSCINAYLLLRRNKST